MASAQSPKDILEQWLTEYQAVRRRSEDEMRALRSELEHLNERQIWRFLDWLGERQVRGWQGDVEAATPATTPVRAADTQRTRIAGFGLPRLTGSSPWSLRPRKMKGRRHGLSA
jgi:hypothetical protein